jgi:hypothetical protein
MTLRHQIGPTTNAEKNFSSFRFGAQKTIPFAAGTSLKSMVLSGAQLARPVAAVLLHSRGVS